MVSNKAGIHHVEEQQIFMLSGMSESGKSTAGRYFENRGVPRLKIKDILSLIYEKSDKTVEFDPWSWLVEDQGDIFYCAFTQEALDLMRELRCNAISLESLHGIKMARGLKAALGDKLKIIFIDVPFKVRVRRQMLRAHLSSELEASEMLRRRDQEKALQGTPEIQAMADYTIDNSGSIEELYLSLERILDS